MKSGICLALSALFLTVPGCKRAESLAWIELYSGFATPAGGTLIARVHQGDRPQFPKEHESTFKRIEETYEALEGSPLADAPMTIRVGNQPLQLKSNSRGYVFIGQPGGEGDTGLEYSPLLGARPPLQTLNIHLELCAPQFRADPWDDKLPVYDNEPGLAVISDIDDTLLDSDIVHKAQMVENALTRSTWELRTFPAAASVLSGFARGRPVFYISGSPWAFRERIHSFFARSGFPEGPFLLKRFRRDPLFDQMAFKRQHIDFVRRSLSKKKWLLFGDSGEKDPEIYAKLRADEPGCVEAIYIHLVTKEKENRDSPRFKDMIVFEDWQELAALSQQRQ